MLLNFHRYKLIEIILSLIFPLHCIECRKIGSSYLCQKCLSSLHIYNERVIGVSEVENLFFVSRYSDHLASKIIKNFKYKYISGLGHEMSILMSQAIPEEIFKDNPPLIPVPLFKTKERQRGFNQSFLLVKHISEIKNLQIFNCLIRNRYTKPQSEISNHSLKSENVSGCFSFVPSFDVKDKSVLIVDDVCTSGSTLSECARILRLNGAKSVNAIVFARG